MNQRIEVLQAQVWEAQHARNEMCDAKVAAEEQAKKYGREASKLQVKNQDLRRLVGTLLKKLEGLAATRATCNARNVKIRRMSEVGTETPILASR
jgi:cell division septum initiation protein DivIVA